MYILVCLPRVLVVYIIYLFTCIDASWSITKDDLIIKSTLRHRVSWCLVWASLWSMSHVFDITLCSLDANCLRLPISREFLCQIFSTSVPTVLCLRRYCLQAFRVYPASRRAYSFVTFAWWGSTNWYSDTATTSLMYLDLRKENERIDFESLTVH